MINIFLILIIFACVGGAIGAIDETLIHARIPINKQVPYRGRGRRECSQNVVAICDLDIVGEKIVF